MQDQYIPRRISSELSTCLKEFPVVAILGPRQSGKSTLARHFIESHPAHVILDLEKPSDFRKLTDPELFFRSNRGRLICLDEIQRAPELFTIIRSVIDETRENGQFLILGSASRDLIRQSSETLAGRIAYLESTPFLFSEIMGNDADENQKLLNRYWLRGGFPLSFLAQSDETAFRWLDQFLRTFLERDIPQMGFRIPAESLGRFTQMLAHEHGQVLNASKLGQSMGLSHVTIRRYLDLLSKTFMVRILLPCETNLKKRLVKSPKVYVRDTGVVHALLGLENFNALLGHPVYGASWEGMVLEHVLSAASRLSVGFYRTSAGAEMDLVVRKGVRMIGIECKASLSPQVSRGFWNAMEDLRLDEAWIAAPVEEGYPVGKNVHVLSIPLILEKIASWE